MLLRFAQQGLVCRDVILQNKQQQAVCTSCSDGGNVWVIPSDIYSQHALEVGSHTYRYLMENSQLNGDNELFRIPFGCMLDMPKHTQL